MEEDWKPFEIRETEKGETLYLHGTPENRIKVEADKVGKILEAIKRGWNVDIQYAIIDGSIDISDIELERDESGRHIIADEIRIVKLPALWAGSFTGFL